MSTAPIEGRTSEIVDISNACYAVAIPTEIFDCNIKPSNEKPKKVNRGNIALIT